MWRDRDGRRREVDVRIDLILVLTTDRRIQLVAWRRHVEEAADLDEWRRGVESQIATGPVGLGLGRLANPFRVQQRREREREHVDDDGATGSVEADVHRSEPEVDEGGDALRTEGVDDHQPDGERSRLRHGRQALESLHDPGERRRPDVLAADTDQDRDQDGCRDER